MEIISYLSSLASKDLWSRRGQGNKYLKENKIYLYLRWLRYDSFEAYFSTRIFFYLIHYLFQRCFLWVLHYLRDITITFELYRSHKPVVHLASVGTEIWRRYSTVPTTTQYKIRRHWQQSLYSRNLLHWSTNHWEYNVYASWKSWQKNNTTVKRATKVPRNLKHKNPQDIKKRTSLASKPNDQNDWRTRRTGRLVRWTNCRDLQ
jgi:hypothetical protein